MALWIYIIPIGILTILLHRVFIGRLYSCKVDNYSSGCTPHLVGGIFPDILKAKRLSGSHVCK